MIITVLNKVVQTFWVSKVLYYETVILYVIINIYNYWNLKCFLCKCILLLIHFITLMPLNYKSHNMIKHTVCQVRPTKTEISLWIPAVWSVFLVRLKTLCILGYLKCTQWRFLSDCANVQAHLNLHWGHVQRYIFWNCGYLVIYFLQSE